MSKIKIIHLLIPLALFLMQTASAMEVKISRLSGEVQVRRGLDETWQPVSLGIFIKEVDTILTGEKGEVVLDLGNGVTFTLGPNSILDVSDLRKITERQLFLYLVKEKVNRVEKHQQKTELRLGKVSVVHGANLDTAGTTPVVTPESWTPVVNGALALFRQDYYPNAIIKFHKILDSGLPEQRRCEVFFYLGRAFEAMSRPGQAIEAYRAALDDSSEKNAEWTKPSREAVERLKQQQRAAIDDH